MTDAERAAVFEVAGDLQESGRALEAWELLEREAPDRLQCSCPACGSWWGAPCLEPGITKLGPSYWSYRFPRLVPCESRAYAQRYATQEESYRAPFARGSTIIARAKKAC